MRRGVRVVAVVAALVLLAATGCRRGRPAATEEPTTPTPTPGVESLGEFQLVATVEQAMITVGPDVDLPSPEGDQLEEGTAGRVFPDVNGVMRVVLEAFSDNLVERCQADKGDRFNLFWRADALFDEALASGNDREGNLEGRRIGVLGTAFLKPEAADGESADEEDEFNLGGPTTPPPTTAAQPTTTPLAPPGVTTDEGETDCVLRAEQVGSSSGDLPTPLPTRRATATPTRGPTATPTRRPTPTPTRRPTAPPTTAPPTTAPPTTAPPTTAPPTTTP